MSTNGKNEEPTDKGFRMGRVEAPTFRDLHYKMRRRSGAYFSPIAFGNQTISSRLINSNFPEPVRLTALRPYFAVGLPLSVQSHEMKRTITAFVAVSRLNKIYLRLSRLYLHYAQELR